MFILLFIKSIFQTYLIIVQFVLFYICVFVCVMYIYNYKYFFICHMVIFRCNIFYHTKLSGTFRNSFDPLQLTLINKYNIILATYVLYGLYETCFTCWCTLVLLVVNHQCCIVSSILFQVLNLYLLYQGISSFYYRYNIFSYISRLH